MRSCVMVLSANLRRTVFLLVGLGGCSRWSGGRWKCTLGPLDGCCRSGGGSWEEEAVDAGGICSRPRASPVEAGDARFVPCSSVGVVIDEA